jgi:hypothetical protein
MSLLAAGWRIAFLTAAAPVLGGVLLLAIARLTGARWEGYAAPARLAPTLALALGAGVTGFATARAPEHLALWMAPIAVTARGIAAGLALAWASRRLRRGAARTVAAVTLAVYAALATPVAADWMLGQAPGHPVSAIGMMLTTEAIASASAFALVAGLAGERTRADLSRLAVAATLGLSYLAFMDYLIVWYGNLPARVGFYLERDRAVLVWAALAFGLGAPVALFSLGRQRAGGAAMLAGAFLFNAWWVGGGLAALGIALPLVAAAALGFTWLVRREARGG